MYLHVTQKRTEGNNTFFRTVVLSFLLALLIAVYNLRMLFSMNKQSRMELLHYCILIFVEL